MARTSVSGFPEWTPAGRMVEKYVVDTVRRIFELHGFTGIETRAVESLDDLLRKGETSQEVYVLRRLQETEETDATLGLHFDLTVPFARYILENSHHVAFPFKRYQIQKCWRGERPQAGRFREFRQADIDVVGDGTLPFVFEVELAVVIAQALSALPVPSFRLGVNNRKISQGFYSAIGLTDTEGALRAIDKLNKIGPEGVAAELRGKAAASDTQIELALRLAAVRAPDTSFVAEIRALGVSSPLLAAGVSELEQLIGATCRAVPGKVYADLSIARGLDYYTGTVYEATFTDDPGYGSIAGGGRYDSLVSDGKRTYPGVGISLGISRIVARILAEGRAAASRPVPTAVLVTVTDEEHRAASDEVAAVLRGRGIPTEVAPSAAKFGRQIRYADRRSIPYVWFTDSSQVKDIRSGDQVEADPHSWTPAAEDWWPQVTARTGSE